MRFKYSLKLIGFGKYEEVKEEINEPRQIGFYWVKFSGQWTIAEWIEDGWFFLGDIGSMKDDYFERIFENRIEPPNI